jgi:cell division protein FtsQ
MAEKRKISIRKILQVFLTIVVTTGCIVAMVSASKIEDSKTVKSVAVHIRNDKKYHFIEEKEILDLAINNRNVDIEHMPISRLDIRSMEHVISSDPWVANAQVFVDNNNVLEMYITQRIPVARLFQQNGQSYYLDTTLSIMPLSNSYIYYTTVITNVPEMKNDSSSWALRKDLISVVRTIQTDSFWSAQISQVIVDSNYQFELIPVLGNQRILLGDATGLREKLNNLFVFYKKVLNRIGWDKYETLDVRFKDQVVASPSLPYKGPVDKAVVNMNWINSIVETEAKNDAKDSTRAAETKATKAAAAQKKEETKKPVAVVRPIVKPALNAAAKKNTKKPDTKKAVKKKPTKNDKNKKVKLKDKKKDNKKDKKIENNKNKQSNKKPKYVLPEKKDH